MNYINWKVNIQNIQNFLQVLYWSLKVTNAPKLISIYLIDNMQNQTILSYILMIRKYKIF